MIGSPQTVAQAIVSGSIWIALVLLAAAFLLTVLRVVKGPTLPDRVVALDMLVGIVIGFIALIAIRTGFTLYIDIAIALGLVGFLATVAFARFILAGAAKEDGEGGTHEPPQRPTPLPQPEAPPAPTAAAKPRKTPKRTDPDEPGQGPVPPKPAKGSASRRSKDQPLEEGAKAAPTRRGRGKKQP